MKQVFFLFKTILAILCAILWGSQVVKERAIKYMIFQGSRKLREAEEAFAEPRCSEQGAEEGGEGGKEKEGRIRLGGKLKVKLLS